jgi:hypothetical protein
MDPTVRLDVVLKAILPEHGQILGPSHFTTDGQSVSMSWCRAPSGAYDQMSVNCLTVTVLSNSGALSDERSGLSFVSHSL